MNIFNKFFKKTIALLLSITLVVMCSMAFFGSTETFSDELAVSEAYNLLLVSHMESYKDHHQSLEKDHNDSDMNHAHKHRHSDADEEHTHKHLNVTTLAEIVLNKAVSFSLILAELKEPCPLSKYPSMSDSYFLEILKPPIYSIHT